MAPNHEPQEQDGPNACPASAAQSAARPSRRSAELVSTGLIGRQLAVSSQRRGGALAPMVGLQRNLITSDMIRNLTRAQETFANSFALQVKQMTDSVALLTKPKVELPQNLVASQLADQQIKALTPALIAPRPLALDLPTFALSRSVVALPAGALGLGEAQRLARLTTGLNEALFRSFPDFSEMLSGLGGLGARPGWDLTSRVRIGLEAARSAAVRGDSEEVEAFADRWLDLPRSKYSQRMLALADALLWLDDEHLQADRAWGTLQELERQVRRNMQSRKLIGDTEFRGQKVYYLEDMNSSWGEERALSLCPATPSPETIVVDPDDFNSMRVGMVLARLEVGERDIALAKGQRDGNRRGGISWEKAALDVGSTEKEGRRVGAKAKRIAAKIMAELQDVAELDGTLQ